MSIKLAGLAVVGGFICIGAVQAVTGIFPSISGEGSDAANVSSSISLPECSDTSLKIPEGRLYPTNGRRGSGRYVSGSGVAPKAQIDCYVTQALIIMEQQKIPGTYEGIWHILMNESGGKMTICNDWDINAQAGTPSCGPMQVILPTFKANHCPGTSWELNDPVANICAASLYASRRYGKVGGIDGAPTPY